MSLTQGERLGPYEILAPIGAGGMGAVYRARDTRLKREVAIKVIATDPVADPERLVRFEREARVASSIEHPNIVTVYDVGNRDGVPYLVLELLTGRTLREELLTTGALTVRRSLEIAAQIARGLAAAHERGIVHRDLKPENVFVLADGRVKVLDFGLARWRSEILEPNPALLVATTVDRGTAPGAILGTVGYMSPEQARGQSTDHRSDLFSLGCILYEMLSGKRSFERDTPVDTLSALLSGDPPSLVEVAPGRIPPVVDALVRRCLQKSPTDRFQSARDLGFALEVLAGSGSPQEVLPIPESMKEGWTIRPWLATLSVIGLGALITVTVTTLRNEDLSASNPPAAHWTLPHITSDYSMPYAIPLVSPDGGHLAIRAISVRELDSRVFAKSLSGGQVWEIPFSRDVNGLAWSPAGKDLYFRSGETLYRASVAEKRVEQVCSGIGSVFLTTIGRDGVLLGHEQDADGGIVRLHPEDCSVEPILAVDPDREETFLRHPELLPDGRLLYFASLGSTGETRFTELGRGPGRPIVQTRTQSLWAHPDHLLYLKDGTLFALRVNPETLDPIGEPWPIALDVLEDVEGGLAHVSASATGVLAFVSASSRTRLVRKGSGSVVEELLADRRMSLGDLDSTGTRLLLASNGPEGRGDDLWILDLRTGKRDRLTSDPRPDWGGLWTPDGRSVVYARDVGLESELRVMSLEAPSDDRLLLRRRMIWPSDLTPDGSSVVFTQYNHALGTPELWRIPLRGGTAEPFLREIGAQTSALYSDDGQWISFFSSRNGPFALFVAPSDGSARPIAVPGETPLSYRWRRDTPSLLMSTVGIGRLTNWSSARAERSGDTVSVARTEPVFTSELPGDCLEARSGSFLCTETDLENSNLHHIVVNWRSLTSPVR